VVDAVNRHPVVLGYRWGDRAWGDLLGGHLAPLWF
jgi:hypothetical protein